MLVSGDGKSQFVRYLLAGGVAALVNYVSRFIFDFWLSFEAAVVLAFLVGLTTGFVLMRQFVFYGSDNSVLPQATKYVLVNLIALILTVGVSTLLARWMLPSLGVHQHVDAIAHAFGVTAPIITSYVGHRLATFR
jgi:putative flippase GtrA